VLFMGVIYHLRHPLLALDLIRQHVARDMLVCQSLQRGSQHVSVMKPDYQFDESDIFTDTNAPRMQFVEHRFAGDPTNWWIPNRACMEAMLRSSGFRVEARPEPDVYICRTAEPPAFSELPPTIVPTSEPCLGV